MNNNSEKPIYITNDKEFIPDNFVVNALVYDNTDRILLLKRKEKHTYYPGYWSVVMEKVQDGETFDDALYRGINEELGILIQADKAGKMEDDLKKVWKGKKYQIRRYFVGIDDERVFVEADLDKYIWFERDSDGNIDIMPDSMDMIQEFWSR